MSSLLSCSAPQDPKDNGQWGPAPVTQHVHRRLPMSRKRLWKFRPSSCLTPSPAAPAGTRKDRRGHVPELWRHAGICGSESDIWSIKKDQHLFETEIWISTEPPDDDAMQTELCDWSVSNAEGQAKLTCLLWLYSSQAGAFSASSFFYCDVKKTKHAYLFIWLLSEPLIATGGIGAGWSAEPTGRSSVLGGLIWTQQAAVMGSGMSGGEGEVGVYVTHKHKCTSEWAPTSTWQSQRD